MPRRSGNPGRFRHEFEILTPVFTKTTPRKKTYSPTGTVFTGAYRLARGHTRYRAGRTEPVADYEIETHYRTDIKAGDRLQGRGELSSVLLAVEAPPIGTAAGGTIRIPCTQVTTTS